MINLDSVFRPNSKFVRISFNILFVLNTFAGLTQSSNKIRQTFYLSNSGSDFNTGTSPHKPWKTLKEFHAGATYLFRAKDTFYLSIPYVNNTANRVTVISSYGSGANPVICNYRIIYPNLLEPADIPNIWKIRIDNKKLLEGYTSADNSNVGFLMIDTKVFGNKTHGIDQLNDQWDFFDTSGVLYIYSNYRPNSTIYFVCQGTIIYLSNNIRVENLTVEGSGGHGITGTNIKNVIVKNVIVKNIGGSYLKGFGNGLVRYGNGIELWESASHCLIENCNIRNVYDAALTMQGRSPNSSFTNITMKNNEIKCCEQSLEVWQEKSRIGFHKCLFVNNDCSYAGYGWSHDLRPYKKVATHVLVYFPFLGSADIKISRNTFKYAKTCYMILPADFEQHATFSSKKNKIKVNNNIIVHYTNEKFETINSLKVNTTLEKGSKFIVRHK